MRRAVSSRPTSKKLSDQHSIRLAANPGKFKLNLSSHWHHAPWQLLRERYSSEKGSSGIPEGTRAKGCESSRRGSLALRQLALPVAY